MRGVRNCVYGNGILIGEIIVFGDCYYEFSWGDWCNWYGCLAGCVGCGDNIDVGFFVETNLGIC